MTIAAEPTEPSATPVDEHLAVLMADRATLGATLDRFAAAFTALAGLLCAAPDAELVDRVRAGDQLALWPITDDGESLHGRALLEESAQAYEDATVVRRDYNRLFFGPDRMIARPTSPCTGPRSTSSSSARPCWYGPRTPSSTLPRHA